MIYYDENKEISYILNLDANNLYGWAMFQVLCLSGFKWVKHMPKIDEDLKKIYDEDSDKGYILEVDAEYPKNLHNLHSDLSFLPDRMKINKCKNTICMIKNLCCSYKIIKTSIKSWVNIKQNS